MLKLAYVGGLGMMAGPAATHLTADGPARVLRVQDRGTQGGSRDRYRTDWQAHGAELVPTLQQLAGNGDLDGVVVCAGKNGDDVAIISELTNLLRAVSTTRPFILHLSTVSPDFAEAATSFCASQQVDYVNYPLTGGPLGAQLGGSDPKGMLILASGDAAIYQRLLPLLQRLGHPRYFGSSPAAGAITKLVGHHMVFNGLNGIATAAAIHADCFNQGRLGGDEQFDYLAFLNGGAGGTRQWELGLSKGIATDNWEQGFSIHHAVVDAIYAARLAVAAGLSRISIQAMTNTAFTFSYLLNRYPGQTLATHAVAREMIRSGSADLDRFMTERGAFGADADAVIAACVASLPEKIRDSALLEVTTAHFESGLD
ncbi:NAD(P)-binding domain-containing protein [Sedimenticola selenatireducens]|uniref:NAD(P)-binding domain-containing protein n=1 Tax=Sedimenticola selenatireducens TaxID=191960 RepID=UPI003F4A99E8